MIYKTRSLPLIKLLKEAGMCRRHFSSSSSIDKSIIISKSNDIHTNLALEEWFYTHGNFKNKHMLMLWSNNPCVVIGKFQNPWMEANVSKLDVLIPDGIKLARRNSGGGTVYHDRGNLNLTFFTPREAYKRRDNLEVITKAVLKRYGIKIEISPREDLVIGDCKISGTASKLGRLVAYHHCTLLVNANKDNLSKSLERPNYNIKTNATQSIKSKILNLSDVDPSITVETLMSSITEEYLQTSGLYNSPKKDPNDPVPEKLIVDAYEQCTSENKTTKCRILRPTEDEFPGLTDIRDALVNWNWNFGKCPRFTASKSYSTTLFNDSKPEESSSASENNQFSISLVIEEGVVKDVSIENTANTYCNLNQDLLSEFKNRKFSQSIFDEVYECLKAVTHADYVRKVI